MVTTTYCFIFLALTIMYLVVIVVPGLSGNNIAHNLVSSFFPYRYRNDDIFH